MTSTQQTSTQLTGACAAVQDPAFQREAAERWQAIRGASISDAAINKFLDANVQEIADAAGRNYAHWKPIAPLLQNAVWEPAVETFRSWVTARLAWLDGTFADVLAQTPLPTVQNAASG